MKGKTTPRPLVLIVLDGFGLGPKVKGNAIYKANTPYIDSLFSSYPNTQLEASGEFVGLPEGMAGNSEVGHMNLGAGYVVEQDVTTINKAIASGKFFSNKALLSLASHVNSNGSSLHIMGLLSDAVVHSAYDHLLASIEFAKRAGVKNTYVHVFTDGRDSSPTAGVEFVKRLQRYLTELSYGTIVSIVGRYYAMDRDKRWDRTKMAYDLLTLGDGVVETDPVIAIENAYNRGETDEFIKPINVIGTPDEKPIVVSDNDGVLFFNYRTDRPRQLSHAFVDKAFTAFDRERVPLNINFTTMTRYEDTLDVSGVCFEPPHVNLPFSRVISEHGLLQLKVAESEKRAHVTYFFNGGQEPAFKGEDRIIVPSPKVATYDLRPQMSAGKITETLLENLALDKYDFILVNYANPDMVGHTGNMRATIKAIEFIDGQLKKVVPAICDAGGTVIITSDHGNAEQLINPQTGGIDTEHNIFPVPFIYVSKRVSFNKLEKGILSDVTPTMLNLLGIERPDVMTGNDLLTHLSSN